MEGFLLRDSAMTATALSGAVRRHHSPASRKRSILAAIAALVLLSVHAMAQVSSGTIVGTILDASGAVVANAKVEAKNADTGVVSATTASQAGEYRIGELIAGTY